RPVSGIGADRLVVVLALRDAVTSLVTRAVHAAALEEQRTSRPAADDVEQERRDAAVNRLLAAVGGAGIGQRVDAAELEQERRIETEGAKTPARVEPDGVPDLVHRGRPVGHVVRVAKG